MAGVTILIPAAGAASRMRGADKLLETVAGEALLRRQARIALATGARVLVTLPPDRPARLTALEGLAVERIVVPEAAEGMSASLRHGALAAVGASGLMILLADLPEIETDDLFTVIRAFEGDPAAPILRGASEAGVPGHPVLLPARLFGDLAALHGDEGARGVLAAHKGEVRLVPLPGDRAVIDLDTPEDWAAWRARTGL